MKNHHSSPLSRHQNRMCAVLDAGSELYLVVDVVVGADGRCDAAASSSSSPARPVPAIAARGVYLVVGAAIFINSKARPEACSMSWCRWPVTPCAVSGALLCPVARPEASTWSSMPDRCRWSGCCGGQLQQLTSKAGQVIAAGGVAQVNAVAGDALRRGWCAAFPSSAA